MCAACQGDHAAAVQALITAGADVNASVDKVLFLFKEFLGVALHEGLRADWYAHMDIGTPTWTRPLFIESMCPG